MGVSQARKWKSKDEGIGIGIGMTTSGFCMDESKWLVLDSL